MEWQTITWSSNGKHTPSQVGYEDRAMTNVASPSRFVALQDMKEDKIIQNNSDNELQDMEVKHYRSISLYNIMYKLVAKIIIKRMKNLMPSLMSSEQGTFLPGRNIFK